MLRDRTQWHFHASLFSLLDVFTFFRRFPSRCPRSGVRGASLDDHSPSSPARDTVPSAFLHPPSVRVSASGVPSRRSQTAWVRGTSLSQPPRVPLRARLETRPSRSTSVFRITSYLPRASFRAEHATQRRADDAQRAGGSVGFGMAATTRRGAACASRGGVSQCARRVEVGGTDRPSYPQKALAENRPRRVRSRPTRRRDYARRDARGARLHRAQRRVTVRRATQASRRGCRAGCPRRREKPTGDGLANVRESESGGGGGGGGGGGVGAALV